MAAWRAFGRVRIGREFFASVTWWRGDQRGELDRRRDGQDADGPVDRGAAACGRRSVGILTRGYRGKTAGGSEVRYTSDEVQLLQSRLGDRALLGVGADRYKSGAALASRGVKWFILDDGFQHLQLARNVDVVLIDASNPFGGGHVLPAGRLREPRLALQRADVIVITRSSHAPAVESVTRRHSGRRFFMRAQDWLLSILVRSHS